MLYAVQTNAGECLGTRARTRLDGTVAMTVAPNFINGIKSPALLYVYVDSASGGSWGAWANGNCTLWGAMALSIGDRRVVLDRASGADSLYFHTPAWYARCTFIRAHSSHRFYFRYSRQCSNQHKPTTASQGKWGCRSVHGIGRIKNVRFRDRAARAACPPTCFSGVGWSGVRCVEGVLV